MSGDATNIHRHLDGAFAHVQMTSELQDLKEELRSNLSARVEELQADGSPPEDAAATAVRELGDLTAVIHGVAADSAEDDPTMVAAVLHQVRPRPAYVARTIILALLLGWTIGMTVLWAIGVMALPRSPLIAITVVGSALTGGLLTADALGRETSVHYPMRRSRALLTAAATASGLGGLSLIGLGFRLEHLFGPLVAGIALLLLGVIGLAVLGASQTNRTKEWVREFGRTQEPTNRFSTDPTVAARFGLYSIAVWLVSLAGFAVLSMTVGFGWSWLALVAGSVVFLLVLARMLFGGGPGSERGNDRLGAHAPK